jgi:hypothetical protein
MAQSRILGTEIFVFFAESSTFLSKCDDFCKLIFDSFYLVSTRYLGHCHVYCNA